MRSLFLLAALCSPLAMAQTITVESHSLMRLPNATSVLQLERLEVAEEAAVGLAQQAHGDCSTTGCEVLEGELVGEDGLAGAGCSRDEAEAALQQPAAEHDIETGHAGGHAHPGSRWCERVRHTSCLVVSPRTTTRVRAAGTGRRLAGLGGVT